MKVSLFGKSGGGKSTLFDLLRGSHSFHQEGVGARVAIVELPDQRLRWLITNLSPKKFKFPELTFIDPGPGCNFSSPHLLESDFILLVINFFSEGKKAVSILEEIFMKMKERDLGIIEKRLHSLEVDIKKRHLEHLLREKEILEKMKNIIAFTLMLNENLFQKEEMKFLSSFQFLTLKKILIVINYDLNFEQELYKMLISFLKGKGLEFVKIASKFELEILNLPETEREIYRKEFGIPQGEVELLLRKILQIAGIITFYTTARDEVRAWLIKKGTSIIEASGKIHSDIARGFIKAEVISFQDFQKCNASVAKAREAGLLRLEGKDYLVQDGDIIYVRFKV